jgi:cysteine desulfuration protein SufE
MISDSITSDGPASGDTPSTGTPATGTPLEGIVADFELLEDWEDRYRYVIELGRALPPFPEPARTDANKVRGCASQVWLATAISAGNPQPRLTFQGDSDAHIVRGLIAILLAVYSGQRADEILAIDANAILRTLGLADHLSAQRSNGLTSMVERIRADARAASMT